MSNLIKTTTELAMYIVMEYIKPGDVLVDATCGNGLDTLSLAGTGPSKLYAFDVQEQAIANTRKLLVSNGFKNAVADDTIELILDSHEHMDAYIDPDAEPGVKAVVFNLGYLPGGTKDITTSADTTITAAKMSLSLLQKDGILCITMYSGHESGHRERSALLDWSSQLDPHTYHSAHINMNNQKNDPPEILLITKKIGRQAQI